LLGKGKSCGIGAAMLKPRKMARRMGNCIFGEGFGDESLLNRERGEEDGDESLVQGVEMLRCGRGGRMEIAEPGVETLLIYRCSD
jgi:hypothetical protein